MIKPVVSNFTKLVRKKLIASKSMKSAPMILLRVNYSAKISSALNISMQQPAGVPDEDFGSKTFPKWTRAPGHIGLFIKLNNF